uniref:Uncharacterized protein n=1 Tax=Trypanosoma vivax (strain Y486) TaxID=1055687 RepID=G0U0V3_TRYVY|nr:hypothetical protein TVY486_0803140 [Trypanosoma vivax Y486]
MTVLEPNQRCGWGEVFVSIRETICCLQREWLWSTRGLSISLRPYVHLLFSFSLTLSLLSILSTLVCWKRCKCSQHTQTRTLKAQRVCSALTSQRHLPTRVFHKLTKMGHRRGFLCLERDELSARVRWAASAYFQIRIHHCPLFPFAHLFDCLQSTFYAQHV